MERGMSSLVLGIRKEDKNRWERRVPLAPSHVETLVKGGAKVVVEPSTKRIFPDVAYQRVCFSVSSPFLSSSFDLTFLIFHSFRQVPSYLRI